MNLVALAGIPGCGKSTWAKQFFDLKYHIVSPDAIRIRLFGSLQAAHFDREGNSIGAYTNPQVFAEYYRDIDNTLKQNVDVLSDATNLGEVARSDLLKLGAKHGAECHLIVFKNVLDATTRNAAREADAVVPDDVMSKMMNDYYTMLASIVQEPWTSVTKIERTL